MPVSKLHWDKYGSCVYIYMMMMILGSIECALAPKFCGGARTHEISKTQKSFVEIPPRWGLIKIISIFNGFLSLNLSYQDPDSDTDLLVFWKAGIQKWQVQANIKYFIIFKIKIYININLKT